MFSMAERLLFVRSIDALLDEVEDRCRRIHSRLVHSRQIASSVGGWTLALCVGCVGADAASEHRPGGASVEAPAEERASPGEVSADSVSDFSGEQGEHGWFYGYWDRSADADGRYSPREDFQLLQHFGDDPINGLSAHSEFVTGPLWYLEDGRVYTSLWAEGGHPNAAMPLGSHEQVEHWAVRRWKSPVAAEISISGRAGKTMPWGENWSGGCEARVLVDGELLFSTAMRNDPVDYSIDVKVQAGSSVDFLIGPDPSIGVTTFTAKLTSRPVAPEPAAR
ncbi:hypothetical protein PPSIR1_39685 [Plesiocystis pacifica SIR-1]|uniref:Uncharacterized protein n=2 Tax=Plesiocystis pacifica TaxID=191768 RepID=A6FY67_9BACT|nr:hypothetical protein PPSIR1_39685 [Plesiocystis pacifica SIR-1]